jgi:RHS repeat-associated protein
MTQYASNNEVLQTLSADNRQKALEAGSKSKEVAQSLETVNSYNSEGTELEKVEGPLHTIRLANGTQVEARHVTKYSYDEGAPSEGGPYRLVTKTVDSANVAGKEEEPRTTTAGYGGQSNLGWKLHKPTSTTTDPSGLKLTNTTVYEEGTGNVLESTGPLGNQESAPPAYAFSFGSGGTGNGQFNQPKGNAVDSSGDVWVADGYNNRIEKFSSTGTFLAAYGKYGNSKTELQFEQPIGIAINQSTGNIYVGDADNNRVDELSSSGTLIRTFGEVGSGNGQFEEAEGVAIDSKGNVWVTDYGNNRVQEFTESGTYVAQFGEKGSGNGQFSGPNAITISGGNIYVSDNNNGRVEEFNEKREFVRSIGSKGSGNGQLDYPGSIGVDSSGNIYVSDEGNSRIEEFTGSGTFLSTIGSKGSGNGQFSGPAGLTVLASGVMYVDDGGNNRVEEWVTNAGGAHTSQTIYYTTAANAKHENCGGHAEWAGLPCQTQPAKQPETGGLPGLPVTTYTYSMLDEPEIVVQTVGSKTRTETNTYDASGRVLTTSVSSSVGTALPTVTDEYDSKLGLLIKQSVESKTKSLTSVFNSLGQLTSYTDADGNTATYNYDVDGRAEKLNDGKGTQTYSYDTTTGEMTKLVDSAAGTFTATYDLEGNQTSEVLPNGMSANYTLDATGKPVNLEYVKTTYCTEEKEKCRWFKDAVVPSIHGQWLKQTSSLSGQEYTYDAAGRLTQVQDTPVGKGCTTRIYAYDADTNRTSLTTREPGSEGKCASEGGSVETHVYDPADRLIDSGVSYNEFGNTIALPGSDAGGYELTSAFYTDNQLQSQTQNGETIGYNLDPAGRTRETVSTGKIVASVIDHYVGPGEEPAWTSEVSGKWTRNIMGINGALVAVQNNGETPVLQIGNLHGDIVGTASLSETATGLASSADTTEFGVPRTGTPPKYSWVGAHELPTELPSGVIAMGARSYVPQLGRFLQTDPVPGGSADAYTYTFGDPVNSSDPTGEFAQWFKEFAANNATEIAIAAAAREKAAEEEAARKAAEAAERALGMTGDSEMSGGEEWEEWEEWEEGEGEGGYGEYVSAIHNFEGGKEGAHVGSGVFYQLRQESDGEVEVKAKAALRLCRDAAGGARKVEACARYASIFSKIGHWVHKHIIKPAEHFLDEIASNLPKCYPFEIRGGSQCSSSPPGDGGNPFYPLFPEP